MLPNQACSSWSNASSDTKSLASGRSLARSFFCVGFDLPGCRARSRPWWCVLVNELSPAAMALLRPRLDLHVVRRVRVDQVDRRRHRAAGPRPRACCCRRRASRWSPSRIRSPGLVIASSGGAGTSSGSVTASVCRRVRAVRPARPGRTRVARGQSSCPCEVRQLERQKSRSPTRRLWQSWLSAIR